MQRFRQILVYLAGAGPESVALRRASRLARHTGARILVVQVVPEESLLESLWRSREPSHEAFPRARISSAFQELASEAVESLREVGLEAQTRVLEGKPFHEIILEVMSSGADLVIKDAQGEGPGKGGLFGSTALHLLRKAPCPVWVVKPEEPRRYRRIVAAVDPGTETGGGREMAVDILHLATSVAAAEEAELEIVHAWWLVAEDTLRSPRLHLPEREIRGLLEAAGKEAKLRLAQTLAAAHLEGKAFWTTLRKGRPFEVIAERAADADLVVMGTLSRGGVPGFLIGNTAERVLQRLDTSVLAVKPRDFVSPIAGP